MVESQEPGDYGLSRGFLASSPGYRVPTPITPRELADRFVRLLRERTATNDADEVRERFRLTYELVETVFQSGPDSSREFVFRELAHLTALPDLPLWEFACLANTCGVGVENGCDPGYCLGNILERLTGLFQNAKALHDDLVALIGVGDVELIPEAQWPEFANRSPEAAARMREGLSLGMIAKAAMTMLCRSVKLRHEARSRIELIQAAVDARGYSRYAVFLAEVLLMADDQDVIVLDPAQQRGYLVRLDAVRNNAHFFTLLQAAILNHASANEWQGTRPNRTLVQLARGERLLDSVSESEWQSGNLRNERGEVYDQGLWQFYQWPALQPDGSMETWEKAAPYHPWWVWGEMYPTDILELDGVRVVLLGAPEMPRQWSVHFFAPIHPALRSNVTIRSLLGPESVRGWLDRIRSTPRENNPLPPPSAEPPGDTAAA